MTTAEAPGAGETTSWLRPAAVIALMVTAAIAGYASGATGITAVDAREWIRGFTRGGPLVFVGLFVALNTLGLPVPILATVGGAAFGFLEGAVMTLCAMWVTACFQFLLARRIGGDRLRTRLAGRLGRIGLILERRGALAVAAGRLLPGPFSELNMAAGLTPLAFRDFAIGTLLGCAPKAVAWSAVGTALG